MVCGLEEGSKYSESQLKGSDTTAPQPILTQNTDEIPQHNIPCTSSVAVFPSGLGSGWRMLTVQVVVVVVGTKTMGIEAVTENAIE